MGGYQIGGIGTGDDGYDEDGYDESQRAEILEATRDGPSDGAILTDLNPDLGGDVDEDEAEDDLLMQDDELGEEDPSVAQSETNRDEDELQEDFEDDTVIELELDGADEAALDGAGNAAQS